MQRSPDSLGVCPDCETSLFDGHVLVEYEADGERQYYAECPDCRTVVHPA